MTTVDPLSETVVGMEETPDGLFPEAKEEASLENGEMLQGVFRIERFVASGGMGQVFRARDLRLERPVAVKVLHGRLLESASGLKRFQREARSLSRVVHPNVVATYEVGDHDGSPFLVMEFVDGPTLATYIRSKGVISPDEVIRLTSQIASGLEEAHALGIVHRDVKPGNILLHRLRSGGMLAKVVDFGLAMAVEGARAPRGEPTTGRNEILGSPLYMSPEQIEAGELTGASDQYSLAIVVYEMLVGAPPFVGATLSAIFKKHLNDLPPRLEERCRWEGAAAVGEVLVRALAKKPEKRFASLREFLDALRKAAGMEDLSGEVSFACDVCDHRVTQRDDFCRGCGTPVPLRNCSVCGAERRGKRFHCIQCGASLLPRIGARRSILSLNERGEATPEKLASLGILVAFQVCSETMSSEAVEYAVDTFCTSVERENGRPLVVMGGEVLALFGLGGIREREVERAVDASLFVLDTLQRGLPGMEDSPSFPVRIVVELGPIQTEGVGFAWGAARIGGSGIQDVRTLLRASGEGGVFVGKNAWREVRTLYDSETSGNTHRLKNRRRVAILREASFVGGQEVSLVGRDYELQHLERAFKRVVQRGRLVAVPVLGIPGMGKSRLLSEFLGRLNERSEGCTVDVTRCIPSSEGVPFAPFRRSFRTRYPLYDEEDQDTVNALLRHLPGIRELPDDVALLRVQRLNALLGLGGGEEDETWHSPSDPSQELAFEAYSHYIQALAREIPYVLVVDDMQWIRPSSMKLLSYLSQRCIDSPVLLLMTLRERDAERVLSAVDLPASALTSLELEPLAVPDVGHLATTLFGEGVLDKRMLQTLHDLTNGLPQELEEHLEALVESGALRKEATRWVYRPAEPVTAAELPRSLSELVHQRLARLGPDEQRLLRAGALAGATFSSELLSAMVDRTVVDVEIDELVQEGWWMESKVGDFPRSRELSFRQDRVRDAILELLSEENSRGLHLKAAAWLDSVAVDVNPSARTARLARHYTEAGAREQGARFTVARAREYVAAFAGTEAFDAFGEAIDMALPNQSEEVAGDEELLREALIGRIRWGWVLGKHEDVFEAVKQAESAGLSRDSAENQAFWIDVDHLLGEILTVEGKYDRAIQFMERALLASESLDCLDRSAEIRGRICSVSLFEHRFEESERKASQLLKEVPNPPKPAWCRAAASALGALARIAMHNEDYDSSLTLIRRGAEYRSLAGDSVGHQMARIAEANTYFFMGNLEKAVDAYRGVSQELRNLGFRIGASQAECNLAEALLNLGQPKEALELLDGEVERNFRSLKAVPSLVEALRVRGEVFLRLNRSGEALAPLHEALELAEEHNLERAKKPLEELLERVRTAV